MSLNLFSPPDSDTLVKWTGFKLKQINKTKKKEKINPPNVAIHLIADGLIS